jgi:hypothetical protein
VENFNNPCLIRSGGRQTTAFSENEIARLSAESRYAKFSRPRGIFLPRFTVLLQCGHSS